MTHNTLPDLPEAFMPAHEDGGCNFPDGFTAAQMREYALKYGATCAEEARREAAAEAAFETCYAERASRAGQRMAGGDAVAVRAAIRKVLQHHGLTVHGDGVIEADIAQAVFAAQHVAEAAAQADGETHAAANFPLSERKLEDWMRVLVFNDMRERLALSTNDEAAIGPYETLDELNRVAHRAAMNQRLPSTSKPVTLEEALYALNLVVNCMNVPGLSGQRAFALDVLARAKEQQI